jgi:hypothetical protein
VNQLYQKIFHFPRSAQASQVVPDIIHQRRSHHPTFSTINSTNSFSSNNIIISNNSSINTNNTVPQLIFYLGYSLGDEGVT